MHKDVELAATRLLCVTRQFCLNSMDLDLAVLEWTSCFNALVLYETHELACFSSVRDTLAMLVLYETHSQWFSSVRDWLAMLQFLNEIGILYQK